MYWYDEKGLEKDVFVSTRVRLARNLVDYPFKPRLDKTGAGEIISKVENVLTKESGYTFERFSAIDEIKRNALAEKRLISPDMLNDTEFSAIAENDADKTYIMIGEEDHIRIQSILPGLSLESALEAAMKADDLLDGELKYAYDEKLGFLTHCPTNLGTGMRASVMMFLPAVTIAGRMDRIKTELSTIGVTVRGSYGEGTSAKGALYQLSNTASLGQSEEEIIAKLKSAVMLVADNERELRREFSEKQKDALLDRIMRSYGIMKYAHVMSSDEMLKLYADVRLGIVLGYIDSITCEALDTLLISSMPYSLEADEKKALSETERDLIRAEKIRKAL